MYGRATGICFCIFALLNGALITAIAIHERDPFVVVATIALLAFTYTAVACCIATGVVLLARIRMPRTTGVVVEPETYILADIPSCDDV